MSKPNAPVSTVSEKSAKKPSALSRAFSKFDDMLCNSKKALLFIAIYSFVFNYIMELTLRHNPWKAFTFMFTSPIVFLLGYLIVFSTLSLMFFFRKRTFAFCFLAFIWFLIAAVNFFLMVVFQRSTPFVFSDLRILSSSKDIVNNGYIGRVELIFIILAVLVFIALIGLVYFKSKKCKGLAGSASFFSVQLTAITVIISTIYTNTAVSAGKFDNLPNKFRDHGFAFCFLYSVIDNGIDKPKDYSADSFDKTRKDVNKDFKNSQGADTLIHTGNHELLENIYTEVKSKYETMPDYAYIQADKEDCDARIIELENKFTKHIEASSFDSNAENSDSPGSGFTGNLEMPNIIFLQLESFYDVNNIKGYEYSTNPHPVYSMLKEELPGGKLTVPSIGAGTANTEFEVMTGMDVSFFGIAEYPYLSVLQDQTCESICYNAKEYGYKTHALHNHKGNFYDRYKVFPNLGYDTFTSLEAMTDISINQRNWCRDYVLLDQINACLDATDGQDLIYTISVQPHGKYPTESEYENEILMGETPRIVVSGNEHNPENSGFAYYVNQISEVDTFIGDLILELSFRSEPTVLVMYGDHLPAFSVEKYWQLKEGNCYQTDYIIWNNCGIDFSDAKDLTTFQLSSYVYSKLGINCGEINKLNRIYLENDDVDDYRDIRHTYQYAIFYDKSLKSPSSKVTLKTYEPADTIYGITSANISDIFTIDGTTYIIGERFNSFTRIFIDGKQVNTEFLSDKVVTTTANIVEGQVIRTAQPSGSFMLGQSQNAKVYSNDMIVPSNISEEKLAEYNIY